MAVLPMASLHGGARGSALWALAAKRALGGWTIITLEHVMSADKSFPQDNGLTPADYDEYGEEPQQDQEPQKPDEALTDPA